MLQRKQLIEQHKRLNWQFRIYGNLYNWYAAAGIVTPGGTVKEKEIAPEGYRVATDADWTALTNYVIANTPAETTTVGNYLKSKRQVNSGVAPNGGAGGDFNTSDPPRWGADNSNWGLGNLGFDALPAGLRDELGNTNFLGARAYQWSFSLTNLARVFRINTGDILSLPYDRRIGSSIRCCRPITGDPKDGVFIETVQDADGNVYNGIQIGNLVWLDRNLMTTKWNDGTPIQAVTSYTNAAWAALTSAAWCHYNNNPNNSFLTHLP